MSLNQETKLNLSSWNHLYVCKQMNFNTSKENGTYKLFANKLHITVSPVGNTYLQDILDQVVAHFHRD